MITKLLRRDHFTSRKLFFVLYRMYVRMYVRTYEHSNVHTYIYIHQTPTLDTTSCLLRTKKKFRVQPTHKQTRYLEWDKSSS